MKIEYTISREILKSMSKTRFYSKIRNKDFALGAAYVIAMILFMAYRNFSSRAEYFILAFGLAISALSLAYFLPRFAWDPLYVFKARSWLGATVSYEIKGSTIIHTWNGDKYEIPISKDIQFVRNPLGAILYISNQEFVFHGEIEECELINLESEIRLHRA